MEKHIQVTAFHCITTIIIILIIIIIKDVIYIFEERKIGVNIVPIQNCEKRLLLINKLIN